MENKKIKFMKSQYIFYYPIFLNIKDKKCVVIGGGNVAYRKIKTLSECGAKVSVISPEFSKSLLEFSKKRSIQLIRRSYRRRDINGAKIVVAATGDKEVNRKISEDSKKAGAIVNVADDIELSDFIVPSFFRRGTITIAISTGGKSPYMAKKIREMIEKDFAREYELLTNLIGDIRARMKKRGIRISRKKWESIIDVDKLLVFLRRGNLKKARQLLFDILKIE